MGLVEWAVVKGAGKYKRDAEQALCMLLYWLASPGQLKDIMHVFGVSRSQISSIVTELVEFLYEKYSKKLLWDHKRLSQDQLQAYVKAIDETVGESIEIWGFIDRTVQPVARATEGQETYYSGHKGYHGIKYQSIVTPDRLISSLYGPELSPKGDWKLWQESGVEQILRQIFNQNPANQMLYLYGDPAYAPSYEVRGPY